MTIERTFGPPRLAIAAWEKGAGENGKHNDRAMHARKSQRSDHPPPEW
jgi:hypothetical protein